MTSRLILTHTGGLTVEGFGNDYKPGEPVPSIIDMLVGKAPAKNEAVVVDTLPGIIWHYSGRGYTILQKAIIDISKEEFDVYISKHIFSKIGMYNSTFQQPLPNKYIEQASFGNKRNGDIIKSKWNIKPYMAAGGLWATPVDLARFVIEIQKSYQGNSNKIISQKMTKQMLTKGLGSWSLGINLDGQNDSLSFSHAGGNDGFRCIMFGFVSLGKGIVIVTNSDNGEQLSNEILRSASIVYKWSKFTPTERTVFEMDTSILKKYTGIYQLQPGAEVEITLIGKTLYGQNSWDHYSYSIYPESETNFFELTLPLELKFDINKNKEVIGFDGKNMDKKYYFKKIK